MESSRPDRLVLPKVTACDSPGLRRWRDKEMKRRLAAGYNPHALSERNVATNDDEVTTERIDSSDSETISDLQDVAVTPADSEAEVPIPPKTYHVRLQWIDECYNLRPAGSNDFDMPADIATFSQLRLLVSKDAGIFTPFTEFTFYAYNKYGNLVALGSRSRLLSWVQGLGSQPSAHSPAVLWIAEEPKEKSDYDKPSRYMAAIERITAERLSK